MERKEVELGNFAGLYESWKSRGKSAGLFLVPFWIYQVHIY